MNWSWIMKIFSLADFKVNYRGTKLPLKGIMHLSAGMTSKHNPTTVRITERTYATQFISLADDSEAVKFGLSCLVAHSFYPEAWAELSWAGSRALQSVSGGMDGSTITCWSVMPFDLINVSCLPSLPQPLQMHFHTHTVNQCSFSQAANTAVFLLEWAVRVPPTPPPPLVPRGYVRRELMLMSQPHKAHPGPFSQLHWFKNGSEGCYATHTYPSLSHPEEILFNTSMKKKVVQDMS